MKRTTLVIILLVIWALILIYDTAIKPNNTIEIIPVANADTTTETTTTEPHWHSWSEWKVTKIDNLTGPGTRVRTCSRCNLEQSRSYMEKDNSICIPKLKVNTTFAYANDHVILNADFTYYTPSYSQPTVMSTVDLSSLKPGDMIYINTEYGLYLYIVGISEPATLNAENMLIGDNTKRTLWQHDYEKSLHLYNLNGETGWIVVAKYMGTPK